MDGLPGNIENPDIQQIKDGLKNLPSLDPPESLLLNVMDAVRTTRRPWTHRLYRWATAPRHFTFTALKMAPFAAALVLFGIFSTIHFFREDVVLIVQNESTGGVPVTLSLEVESAESVTVVGSFNAWRGEGYEMQREAEGGRWTLTVILPEGRYEYGFEVDGKKILTDPRALLYQDDGFGNRNAVLIVGNGHEKAI